MLHAASCCLLYKGKGQVKVQKKKKTDNERRTMVAGSSRVQDAAGRTRQVSGNQCILSFVIKLLRDNAASGEMNF